MIRITRSVTILIVCLILAVGCNSGPTPESATAPPPTDAPTETDAPEPTAEPPTATIEPAPEPVAVDVFLGRPPVTLDPVRVAPLDLAGSDLVENLFVGLTRLDPDTGEVHPWLAESWERSGDGLTWTVFLRDDMQWVQVNPDSGEVTPTRPITAGDVVTAARRACTPDTAAPMLSAMLIIDGCLEVYAALPSERTDELYEGTLGVRVLNDVAVEFRLTNDAAYFPSVIASPILRPVPADLIAEHGEAWTAPANLWTSGPYALAPGSSIEAGYTLLANPTWPDEFAGNVGVVRAFFGDDPPDAEVDIAVLSAEDVAAAPAEQIVTMALPVTHLIAISYDTFGMDRAGVRQGLALAIDRQAIVDEVLRPAGVIALPADSIIPPGTASDGGPTGLAYDPDAARAAMAEASYPECGFLPPEIRLLTDQSALSLALMERYDAMWTEVFGCVPRQFIVEQETFRDVLTALRVVPTGQFAQPRAALITLTWQGEWPDAHHWLTGVVGCREAFPDAYLNTNRGCIDADSTISTSAVEHDAAARVASIGEIEAALFGSNGEMPAIPIYTEARAVRVAPHISISPVIGGAFQFDRWVAGATE